eukprot:TRINITY_DN11307_c0_g1_i4.p1 TRINITY_DN11307_c0_g1~~TRINITY_DN11307_c0_g1_i4.p1  ORF type:complete len:256 (+),score=36.24 TRINITY_DN11307_c0_g1_i4:169-936(+)
MRWVAPRLHSWRDVAVLAFLSPYLHGCQGFFAGLTPATASGYFQEGFSASAVAALRKLISTEDSDGGRRLEDVCNEIVLNPEESARSYSSTNGEGNDLSMLDSEYCWRAESPKPGEWLQMDLGERSCVQGVVTQPCTATMIPQDSTFHMVTEIEVYYSEDGDAWQQVPGTTQDNTFIGHPFSDVGTDNQVQNNFDIVAARYVRIVAARYTYPAMRAAVVSCDPPIWPPTPAPTAVPTAQPTALPTHSPADCSAHA